MVTVLARDWRRGLALCRFLLLRLLRRTEKSGHGDETLLPTAFSVQTGRPDDLKPVQRRNCTDLKKGNTPHPET